MNVFPDQPVPQMTPSYCPQRVSLSDHHGPRRSQSHSFLLKLRWYSSANEAFNKDGTPLTTPNVKPDILEKLAHYIYNYTTYPTKLQIIALAEALIKAHPCLKERSNHSGYAGWQSSIKYKRANYHTKLKSFGVPDAMCNALKHKHPDNRKSAKNVKKPRKAEVNYLPPYPAGENQGPHLSKLRTKKSVRKPCRITTVQLEPKFMSRLDC
ncbi:hypothetical protein N1851_009339 [Merluccius polli]|uniref:Uncharacterized protein n=1 Tax=Merluccius polli TaxID=89951 RepID=A0AA47N037_MERPO|nr:hypothetical protein N1851_009339 [Merluccius polli]